MTGGLTECPKGDTENGDSAIPVGLRNSLERSASRAQGRCRRLSSSRRARQASKPLFRRISAQEKAWQV